MGAALRWLAGLALGLADYLTAWLPPQIGDRLCVAADDVYCECEPEGDAHA